MQIPNVLPNSPVSAYPLWYAYKPLDFEPLPIPEYDVVLSQIKREDQTILSREQYLTHLSETTKPIFTTEGDVGTLTAFYSAYSYVPSSNNEIAVNNNVFEEARQGTYNNKDTTQLWFEDDYFIKTDFVTTRRAPFKDGPSYGSPLEQVILSNKPEQRVYPTATLATRDSPTTAKVNEGYAAYKELLKKNEADLSKKARKYYLTFECPPPEKLSDLKPCTPICLKEDDRYCDDKCPPNYKDQVC